MGHIDSIRGVAALLVLFLHTASSFISIPAVKAHGTLLHDFASDLSFGKTGVIAFFAISGFVICPSLKGQQYKGSRKFVIRRFFRLFPAFWTAICLTLLVNFVWKGRAIDWSQVLGNIPMLYSAFRVEPLQGLFWTLEVELVFYFLCLILFLCGGLHKPAVLFTVGLILVAIFQCVIDRPTLRTSILDIVGVHWVEMPEYLAIMFWGGLFRAWYDDRQGVCSIRGYQIPIVVFVVALLFIILLRHLISLEIYAYYGDFDWFKSAIPYFLGLGLFVVGSLYVQVTNPFFVWLGAISYSIYLLHPVVFWGVIQLIRTEFLKWGDMHLGVYLLVCTVLTILLSGLVYHLIEKPAIKLGRFLQNR
jgi:peptidoglycan/LPS O-acetylase OafA/YrhL